MDTGTTVSPTVVDFKESIPLDNPPSEEKARGSYFDQVTTHSSSKSLDFLCKYFMLQLPDFLVMK